MRDLGLARWLNRHENTRLGDSPKVSTVAARSCGALKRECVAWFPFAEGRQDQNCPPISQSGTDHLLTPPASPASSFLLSNYKANRNLTADFASSRRSHCTLSSAHPRQPTFAGQVLSSPPAPSPSTAAPIGETSTDKTTPLMLYKAPALSEAEHVVPEPFECPHPRTKSASRSPSSTSIPSFRKALAHGRSHRRERRRGGKMSSPRKRTRQRLAEEEREGRLGWIGRCMF